MLYDSIRNDIYIYECVSVHEATTCAHGAKVLIYNFQFPISLLNEYRRHVRNMHVVRPVVGRRGARAVILAPQLGRHRL